MVAGGPPVEWVLLVEGGLPETGRLLESDWADQTGRMLDASAIIAELLLDLVPVVARLLVVGMHARTLDRPVALLLSPLPRLVRRELVERLDGFGLGVNQLGLVFVLGRAGGRKNGSTRARTDA